jgi:multiple sugar transport system permease protein
MLAKIQNKPFIWILPIIIFLALFYFYPMFEVFRLSFTNATLLSSATSYSFNNYINIFSDSNFYRILKTTFIFVFFSIFFQILLGLIIALFVNRGIKRKLFGAVLTRSVVLSCWIIPGIAIGLLWKIMFSEFDYGIINYIIDLLFGKKLPFLSSPSYALTSIIIANIWCGTAFSMLILFSGLQRIPEQLYEAATVDGGSPWQQLIYITLPQLSSFIFINVALTTIYTFNTFGLIMSLTGGGPGTATEVLSMRVYTTVFGILNISKGSAVAVILLLINLSLATLYYLFFVGDANKSQIE